MGAVVGILRRCGVLAAAASVVLLGAARAGEGVAGSPIRVFTPDSPYLRGFGEAIAAAGDVDGDGYGDLAIGAPRSYPGGTVVIVSGADGTILRTLAGAGDLDGFGEALALVGDLDGRGAPDLLVGAPRGMTQIPESSQPTFARVFAGEDGAVLFDSGPRDPDAAFGAAVAGLGDLDGDGVPEFAVGAPDLPRGDSTARGNLEVHSGTDGHLLGTVVGPEEGGHLGASIAPLGDLDGDDVPDLAVGVPGSTVGRHNLSGRVSIVSGATLEEIRSIPGPDTYSYFGRSISALGTSGEASRTLVVGNPRARGGRGACACP